MLTRATVISSLGLPPVSVDWVRFETEAPVDDILAKTSAGGFIAIQAKTSLSLTTNSDQPFAQVIKQVIKHWLTCHSGDGSLEWNRPLDPAKDRLVLAVTPRAPESLRIDLPAAIKTQQNPGAQVLTQRQSRAYQVYEDCVQAIWSDLTAQPIGADVLSRISSLFSIVTIDLDVAGVAQSLAPAVIEARDAVPLVDLLTQAAGEMMTRRGGADVAMLRRDLLSRGARLASHPDYRSDIDRLRQQSARAMDALAGYEVVNGGDGSSIGIDRDCQDAVLRAAKAGPLLITGEPGAGKSGVLISLARQLTAEHKDVIVLAVDRHSVETLEGLSSDLHLERQIVDVIDAWDGSEPAWLIIDALDATRGGRSEAVFRTLIERVMEKEGRWIVVASIRSFDLRMGQRFRTLFAGSPPESALAEHQFPDVRHVRIPVWSPAELQRLLEAAPVLRARMKLADARLRELAEVPFNTRLIGELVANGVDTELNHLSSQVGLLGLYWRYRVEAHGLPAEVLLHRAVSLMVSARSLKLTLSEVAGNDPRTLEALVRDGVLVLTADGRQVSFRHHLLFDYSASRLFVSFGAEGQTNLRKGSDAGLILGQAVTFHLQSLWTQQSDHSDYWKQTVDLLSDESCDPVVRSVLARATSELLAAPGDGDVFGNLIRAGYGPALLAFPHIVGALAVRFEDGAPVVIDAWAHLARAIAVSAAKIEWPLRVLCFQLVERADSASARDDLGIACRALLEHAFTGVDASQPASPAIGLVARTFDTDPVESRRLLTRIFDDKRFADNASAEVPELARYVECVGKVDADFVAEIYAQTYRRDVEVDKPTSMGDSRILPLRSSARQDYGLGKYALGTYFPQFLRSNPPHAIGAMVAAVNAYIEREHPPRVAASTFELPGASTLVRLRDDYSYIWASDPQSPHAEDAEVLLVAFVKELLDAPEENALTTTRLMLGQIDYAIYWSRLFMCAAKRGGATVDLLWPYAAAKEFLLSNDTRKDAIDAVAAGIDRRSTRERMDFERSILGHEFSELPEPDRRGEWFQRMIFGAIGSTRLLSDDARSVADSVDGEEVNGRQSFTVTSRPMRAYEWIDGLDKEDESNAALIVEIEALKDVLGIERTHGAAVEVSAQGAVHAIKRLSDALARYPNAHIGLKRAAEGAIGAGIQRVLSARLLPSVKDSGDDPASGLVPLISEISYSFWPEVDEDTESRFENSPAWGSPAPRVDAAETSLNLLLQRPALHAALMPMVDRLLVDPHPAVRLQASLHLVRIWDMDRPGFWAKVEQVMRQETNFGVLAHFCADVLGRVLHHSPAFIEELTLELLSRCGVGERASRLRRRIASVLAILWAVHGTERSKHVLEDWIDRYPSNLDEVKQLLADWREGLVVGLGVPFKGDAAAVRRRSREMLRRAVGRANEAMSAHVAEPGSVAIPELEGAVELIDGACREIYFASGASRSESGRDSNIDLSAFYDEVRPILFDIAMHGTPSTIHYLLQLLEQLVPIDPGGVFDILVFALRNGGAKNGYQYESLASDLLVRIVGRYLADYKEIFENDGRRANLVECLDMFIRVGWPAARRLLYRLPDLIQ